MDIQEGDQVELIIGKETDLGFTVLIEEEFEGLLYRNEIFQELNESQRVTGYIKQIREDGKIDVALRPQGFRNVIESDSDTILNSLHRTGSLPLTDKSDPELIKATLKMSKKAFKKAIGNLYKQKLITLKADSIELLKK